MAFILNFGKYRGTSLEEVALGKNPKGSTAKSVGYYYFKQLAEGDPQYFGRFQNSPSAMRRWNEIYHKLDNFKPVYPCSVCNERVPDKISIAFGHGGISMGRFLACESQECRDSLTVDCNGALLYDITFDLIAGFGWSGGGDKGYEKMMTELMRDLAGWKKGKRLTPESATDFINSLTVR